MDSLEHTVISFVLGPRVKKVDEARLFEFVDLWFDPTDEGGEFQKTTKEVDGRPLFTLWRERPFTPVGAKAKYQCRQLMVQYEALTMWYGRLLKKEGGVVDFNPTIQLFLVSNWK